MKNIRRCAVKFEASEENRRTFALKIHFFLNYTVLKKPDKFFYFFQSKAYLHEWRFWPFLSMHIIKLSRSIIVFSKQMIKNKWHRTFSHFSWNFQPKKSMNEIIFTFKFNTESKIYRIFISNLYRKQF